MIPPDRRGARRLGLEHFAFMRALVQGLDERDAWDRYLSYEGEASDARLVRSTIAWIRDAFAAAAQREQRFGTARLVRTDLSKLAAPSPALPMLEDFAREHGLDDYSSAEQLAAYEDTYGRASQRLKRRGRLIGRQLEALRWLEGLVAQPPNAGDGVAAWLHPGLARHLEAVGIHTLAQVVERINGIGRRWYGGIPALGPAKAERILGWLRAHQSVLANAGLALGAHVALARRELPLDALRRVVAPATDIRPLEKFIVPVALDGSQGLHRLPQAQCLLTATNDRDAILAWLRTRAGLTPTQQARLAAGRSQRGLRGRPGRVAEGRAGGPAGDANDGEGGPLDWLQSLSNTQRAYRKEAERFLLWAVVQRGKPLASMDSEDCVAYRDFLADPQPRGRWCGKRSRERWSPLWRPFEGPLSGAAQQHAVTILRSFHAFLVEHHYLTGNPWTAVCLQRNAGRRLDAGRSLTLAQWAFVQEQVDRLPSTSTQRRLRFGLHLLYATGLRLSEVTAATVDDLRWVAHVASASAEAADALEPRPAGS